MAPSRALFQRWVCRERSTWPFQVFQQYSEELKRLTLSNDLASKSIYKTLGASQAQWADGVTKHFPFASPFEESAFARLKEWSDAFNEFGNWTRLNTLVAMTSSLETYMASVIALAIESDPGVLLGASRSVDGVVLLKRKVPLPQIATAVESCTKGDWISRLNSYERIFGSVPPLLTDKIADLDAVRRLRNNVSHAFGRDIEASRKHGVKQVVPMERLAIDRSHKYRRTMWSAAKSIDRHLLTTHIGEYQLVLFYHRLFPSLSKTVHASERAIRLKKEVGRFKAQAAGKQLTKGLVDYYESL